MRDQPYNKGFFLSLCLCCGVFLQALMCSPEAVAAGAQAISRPSGLMDKLGLEPFSPDQSLWSDKARMGYEEAKDGAGEPLAVLKIERLNITAPVYRGTKRVTLDRGIGLVEFSPAPGETGNIALSGHRDGFFRPLKDIALGDRVSLYTLTGHQDFLVSDIKIVDALDTSVLEDTGGTVLTLITCHPFYYLGYAPDRYIVKALPADGATADITSIPVGSASSTKAGNVAGSPKSSQ